MLRKTHKGPRLLVNVSLPAEVVRLIDQDTQRCAVSSRSQLLADRVSAWYGRHDLVRELDREQLKIVLPPKEPNADARASKDTAREAEAQDVALRVPREVVNLIDQEARHNGNLARRQHLARLVIRLYSPHEALDEDGKEQLELPLPARREPAA